MEGVSKEVHGRREETHLPVFSALPLRVEWSKSSLNLIIGYGYDVRARLSTTVLYTKQNSNLR